MKNFSLIKNFFAASLGVLSNPVGALLSGLLMDACGRKATILYTTIPFVFGWAMIGLSDNLYTLCLGRCISGLAIGTFSIISDSNSIMQFHYNLRV